MGVAMMQSVAARVLYGTGKIRLFARLMLLEALLNLGLSIALIGRLGIFGVALGTAIPNFVMCLVVIGQVCRMLKVDGKTLFHESIRKPALAAVGLVPAWLLLARLLPPVDRAHFAALISVGVAAYALTVLALEASRLRLRIPVRSRKRLMDQNWSSQK
jgi:O-antigen/teichoic acid export membrane protein